MFRINESTGELFVYDDIGDDWMGMIDDGMIVEALSIIGNDRRVTMRINSPGGDVFKMGSIVNAMRRHSGGVDVAIDGVAGSAAHYLTLGAEKVTIASNGLMMIHDMWTFALGDAKELRKVADDLDVITSAFTADYVEKTGKTAEEIAQIMDDDTWLTAEMAIEHGFADEIGLAIIKDSEIAASQTASMTARKRPQKQEETVRQVSPPQVAAKLRAKLTGIV